jgi:large subunit ribosomal protein L6
MSRIGKLPIALPDGVTATIDGQTVKVKGKKGELEATLVEDVAVAQGEDGITISPRDDSKKARARWGMSRTIVANMVEGVTEGFQKNLEINGVGYRAQAQGKELKMQLGFSHEVVFPVPEGIEIKTPKPTEIEVSGIDKQQVGQVAANIRSFRPPEPYKGKGVKYADEYIYRKEGKKK